MEKIGKEPNKWRGVAIPKVMYDQIKSIIALAGYMSVSEYIRENVRRKLEIDLMRLEEFQETKERMKEEKDLG